MRTLLLLAFVLALAGCAEAVHGPRIVPYTADRFYIRHVPQLDSADGVDLLAGRVCQQVGKEALFEEAEQFVWLDIRYATYRCVADATANIIEEPELPG
jgi:hypothetical protein